MWGNGASELWAVGDSGAIVHYNGSAWSLIPNSPTTATLHGVWGTAANDVWAVGDSGLILHFDGSEWSKKRHSHYANLTFGVGQLVWRSLGSRPFGHSASFHAMNFTPLHSVGTL